MVQSFFILLLIFCFNEYIECYKSVLSPKKVLNSIILSGFLGFNTILVNPSIANAQEYVNKRFGTTFTYPDRFLPLKGDLSGDRKVEAFIDPQDEDTSVSVVFTPIPADYTRLNAFGGSGTLKSYLVPDDSSLISEKTYGETYTVSYETPNTEELKAKHVISVFSLRPAESVVGLTIQTPVERWLKVETELTPIVTSLKVKSD